MSCPHCGASLPLDGGRCPSCGSLPAGTTVAAVDVSILDTTGLPPNASFGPVGPTSAMTGGVPVSLLATGVMTAEVTVDPATSRVTGGPLEIGQSFGPRYHIIRMLGMGGMGAVYQAWDAELNVAVALKVIRRDPEQGSVSLEAERRFKSELLLARQVTHKHVVRIHDLGEINGIKYISMPYLQGHDLATVLRREGRMPVARALKVLRQIADGLAAAHEAGVVHRDLKPANIMLGADDHAWIMDFGISSTAAEAGNEGLIGTPEYMAPEQASGEGVDARADIYAFGLIGYEMLTGPRPPVMRGERLEAMRRRFEEGLPAAKTIEESIPAPVDTIITCCLSRMAADRFQTTAELCATLNTLDEAGEVIPVARRLTPRVMIAAAVIVIGLLVGTSLVTQRVVEPPKPHDPVSVMIADLENLTGDPAFDNTLEPMLKRALEGAGFVSAFDRNSTGLLGVPSPQRLNDAAARELAVKQGIGVVLTGSIARSANAFTLAMTATETVTGNVLATAQGRASTKEQVLPTATRLIAAVRTALGDDTSESAQQFAMASLSSTSLDVVRLYAAAQQAGSNARFEEALQLASKTVEIDPKFGIGYQLMAVNSRNLGRLDDSRKYADEALRYIDSMTERERYSTRGFFYRLTGDYPACVKEYGELIARYAGDPVGHNQLALCASMLRDMRRARDEMSRLVTLLPNQVLFRDNLALYSNYASDFETAAQEAGKVGDTDAYGMLAMAFAQLGKDQRTDAAATYQKLDKLSARGSTLAASGLGDLAAVEGRFSEAARILERGAAADLAAKASDRAAAKLVELAYVEMLRGQKRPAIAAASRAVATSKAMKIRFLAARTLVEAGDIAQARQLASDLAKEQDAAARAHAKILEADLALAGGNPGTAIDALSQANMILDTWIGHFDLGRAYLAANMLLQADSEFDRCLIRRGEGMALFLDEEPTFGYYPSVYYYQGRVREALKTVGYADSYRQYLAFRGDSKEDPLLPQIRKAITP